MLQILSHDYEPEQLCVQPPVNIRNNVSFLINNSKIRREPDIRCDDMGVWRCTGSPKLHFRLIDGVDGKATTAKKLERKPDDSTKQYCILRRSYFVNASSEDCRKVISKLQSKTLLITFLMLCVSAILEKFSSKVTLEAFAFNHHIFCKLVSLVFVPSKYYFTRMSEIP